MGDEWLKTANTIEVETTGLVSFSEVMKQLYVSFMSSFGSGVRPGMSIRGTFGVGGLSEGKLVGSYHNELVQCLGYFCNEGGSGTQVLGVASETMVAKYGEVDNNNASAFDVLKTFMPDPDVLSMKTMPGQAAPVDPADAAAAAAFIPDGADDPNNYFGTGASSSAGPNSMYEEAVYGVSTDKETGAEVYGPGVIRVDRDDNFYEVVDELGTCETGDLMGVPAIQAQEVADFKAAHPDQPTAQPATVPANSN